MNLSYLKNNKGITITELIVTMGISVLLLVFITSGSLFIKNYLKKQSQNSKIFEELSFVVDELSNSISSGRKITSHNDSMIVISNSGKRTSYSWVNKTFMRNNHNLTTNGMQVDSLAIRKIQLPKQPETAILKPDDKLIQSGVYEIFLKISDKQNRKDSIKTIIVNNYEKVKYNQ